MTTNFSNISTAPQDPIFGLIDAFKKNTHPQKMNLTIGVYQDKLGQVPVIAAVKEAAASFIGKWENASYLPIAGHENFLKHITSLAIGSELAQELGSRIAAVQTPGGTGALRLISEFHSRNYTQKTTAITKPTWVNHSNIFSQTGHSIIEVEYLDTDGFFRPEEYLEQLKQLPEGTAVVLHACCHNPTGYDLPEEYWSTLSNILRQQSLFPVLDYAYQGFGNGLDKDAELVQYLIRQGHELLIAYSCSKNFSLYQQRTGAVIVIAADEQGVSAVHSQLQAIVRSVYSNPPAFGAECASRVLGDAKLRQSWEAELTEMRARISTMREGLAAVLCNQGYNGEKILPQRGMFSYSGIDKDTIIKLRTEYGIFIVESGRVCLAALNDEKLQILSNALEAVRR